MYTFSPWDTTLISNQMRSATSFSCLTPSSVGPFDYITFKREGEEEFVSRFTIYLVTRLFADFSPSHGGWLARNASSTFVASLILGLLSKLSGYLVECLESAILVVEKNCFPKREFALCSSFFFLFSE